MTFNPIELSLKDVYTYWVPSRTAMLGMLRLAGFDPLAERSIAKPDRLAVIAKNVSWDAVRSRSEVIERMHGIGMQVSDEIVSSPTGEPSPIVYRGPQDTVALDWATYRPDWAPHPNEMRDVVGKTTWLSEAKNF